MPTKREFIVCVELHEPTNSDGDYEELNERMEAAGFSRTRKAGRTECYLPRGEYIIEEAGFSQPVLDREKLAAEDVSADYSIVVGIVRGIASWGLRQVEPAV